MATTTPSSNIRALLAAGESAASGLSERFVRLLRDWVGRPAPTVLRLDSSTLRDAHAPLVIQTTAEETEEILRATAAAEARQANRGRSRAAGVS